MAAPLTVKQSSPTASTRCLMGRCRKLYPCACFYMFQLCPEWVSVDTNYSRGWATNWGANSCWVAFSYVDTSWPGWQTNLFTASIILSSCWHQWFISHCLHVTVCTACNNGYFRECLYTEVSHTLALNEPGETHCQQVQLLNDKKRWPLMAKVVLTWLALHSCKNMF